MKRNHIAIGLAGFLGLLLLMWFVVWDGGSTDGAGNQAANGGRLSEAELIAANREQPPAQPAPTTPGPAELPTLTPAWLAGTWRPAADPGSTDPNAPCETDVIATFTRDGRYEQGDGSSGRYRISGDQEITLFEHVIREMGTDEEDMSEFDQESRQRIVPIDQNRMRVEGEEMRRCRLG